MTRSHQRRSHEELERLVFQRLLHHLTAIRPDVPMPFAFLDEVLETDLFIEDMPLKDSIDLELIDFEGISDVRQLFSQRSPLDVDVGELYKITGSDLERGVLSITPAQRVAIQQLLQERQRSEGWIRPRTLDESEIVFTSALYFIAKESRPELTPDHLALLASHALFWLENELASPKNGTTLQLYTSLWMLVTHGVLAATELLPYLPRVFEQIEQDGMDGRDPFAAEFLALLGGAIAEASEPGLQSWIELSFAYCESLIPKLAPEEQPQALETLRIARLRAGV